MKTRDEVRKQAVAESVAKIFGIIMVVLYIGVGTTFIIKGPEMRNFPQRYTTVFGVILILYGLFKAYNLYRRYFSKSEV